MQHKAVTFGVAANVEPVEIDRAVLTYTFHEGYAGCSRTRLRSRAHKWRWNWRLGVVNCTRCGVTR